MIRSTWLFASAALAALFLADGARAERSPLAVPPELLAEEGFINSHPDLRWRERGRQEYVRGEFEAAAEYFRRAARHADKPSQAILGEMYWTGRGVARDPALAYVWMDLAAERGYRAFLGRREYLWSQLDAAQQARAVEAGQGLYAEFGDEAAKPRLERILLRGRMQATGSHISASERKLIVITEAHATPGAGPLTDASFAAMGSVGNFHADEYWVPELYWQMQDRYWRDLPMGEIIVQPLQPDGTGN